MNLLEEFTKDEQPALTAETLQQWTRELEDLRARMQGQLLQLSIERDALRILLAKPELTPSMAALEAEAVPDTTTTTDGAAATASNTEAAGENQPQADQDTAPVPLSAWGTPVAEPEHSIAPEAASEQTSEVAGQPTIEHPVDLIYQSPQPAWDLGGEESQRQEDLGETPEEADMMRVLQSLRNLSQSQPQDNVKE